MQQKVISGILVGLGQTLKSQSVGPHLSHEFVLALLTTSDPVTNSTGLSLSISQKCTPDNTHPQQHLEPKQNTTDVHLHGV